MAVIVGADGQRHATIQADGSVEAAAADGSGGWFVSGQFRNIGGYDRSYLAHIESDGDVDPDWDPVLERNSASSSTEASTRLAVGNDRVYLAGDFASVDRKPRSGGAALDVSSGEVDPDWKPNLGTVSNTLAVTPERVVVATGGHVDAYDPSSGRHDPAFRVRTKPDRSIHDGVFALAASGDRLYVGGQFNVVNGTPWGSLARVDARTGRLDRGWHPPSLQTYHCRSCGGPVDQVVVTPSAVYAVGDFYKAGAARARGGLAAFSVSGPGGVLRSFQPARPGRSTLGYSGSYGAIGVVGSRLLAGGDFGKATAHAFVALDPRTGAVLPSWHPRRRPELVTLVVPSGAGALVVGDKLGP